MSDDRIAHQVVVPADAASTFDAFTRHLGAWWPLAYTFSGPSFVDATVESRVGGIWGERSQAGETLSWGEVRAYTPGERLVLAFAIGADRKPVANDEASEVEVQFTSAGPGETRVELEHRDFARHGKDSEALRAGMDSAQGWPLILAELQRWMRVSGTATPALPP